MKAMSREAPSAATTPMTAATASTFSGRVIGCGWFGGAFGAHEASQVPAWMSSASMMR